MEQAAFDTRRFRRLLLQWFDKERRDLPWRRTRDPYAIWISEIMLQQTRVAAVIPYYERFLARFPNVAALAGAAADDLLSSWAGLGYYSRARNLQAAARVIAGGGEGAFPQSYDEWLALPGIGAYTAAAVTSIAFGAPHPAVDGNLLRVIARLTADAADIRSAKTKDRFTAVAATWLDRKRPGDFNQAMMELGATVCTPKAPRCGQCPVRELCGALATGRVGELPVKSRPEPPAAIDLVYAIVQRGNEVLLRQRAADAGILAGFWELPEAREVDGLARMEQVGEFRHAITNHRYRCTVVRGMLDGRLRGAAKRMHWHDLGNLHEIPLTTAAKKALRCLSNWEPTGQPAAGASIIRRQAKRRQQRRTGS